MNNKVLNYLLYGLIILIVIVGLILLVSNNNETSSEENKPSVEELIVENNSINITVDETVKINAYVSNNSNAVLTYFSSNNDVATVDNNGNVKGIDNGTASIIISYLSTTGQKLTKQCFVNVDGGVEITSITLPRGEIVMFKGDTYTLSPEVSPTEFDRTKLSFYTMGFYFA